MSWNRPPPSGDGRAESDTATPSSEKDGNSNDGINEEYEDSIVDM